MGKLDGRVAVVTGAASGNGRAMAVRFAEDGADVVIADLDDGGMEETARLVRQQERQALTTRCDVALKADIDALITATVERFGRIDIAVANAGVAERDTDCLNITEEQWDRTIDINLKGVFFTLQAAANQMIAQGIKGRLIAIASIMAEWGSAGSPAYCASKGGVKQLVKSFGIALGSKGITCNAIGPGFIETQMTARLKESPEFEAYLKDRTPVGIIGDPSDVAAVASFLASDDARFVNGTTIFPDGGITAGLYSNAMREAGELQRAAMLAAAQQ
ncbi:MAG: SDR family NAD(P)-dependent oxidoreductase [Dehalococcoidia bacterium]